jgi:15-cis-phytoene synthase
MEQYDRSSYKLSYQLARDYSTSFGKSMGLLPYELQYYVASIYGLVRIADEIVDTYDGADRRQLLDDLEKEVRAAVKRGYSTNPVVHAFALTAREFAIPLKLLMPFFSSMRADITPKPQTPASYARYIEGSAEVVGLMCLKVFTGDDERYRALEAGARRLGAAYQKVNFLRDLRADYESLGRWYFPDGSFETFDDEHKRAIIADIEEDFAAGIAAYKQLPAHVRPAMLLSIRYYRALLTKLRRTSTRVIKKKRVRVSDLHKLFILLGVRLGL